MRGDYCRGVDVIGCGWCLASDWATCWSTCSALLRRFRSSLWLLVTTVSHKYKAAVLVGKKVKRPELRIIFYYYLSNRSTLRFCPLSFSPWTSLCGCFSILCTLFLGLIVLSRHLSVSIIISPRRAPKLSPSTFSLSVSLPPRTLPLLSYF